MLTLGILLAFAFALAGPSLVGSAEANLPGPGTYAYAGSPVNPAVSQVLFADVH